jgi:glycogen(starch) synthase
MLSWEYPPLLVGGLGRHVHALATTLAAAGHDVTVVTPDATSRTETRSGVRLVRVACRSRGPAMHWEFLARARGVVSGDVVHVHNEPEGAVALGGGTVTVLSFDNFHFRQRAGAALRPAYRRILLRYDRLLPVSNACAAEASAYWGLPRERVRVLPNGVDTRRFAPDPEAARLERDRLGTPGPLVVYLGRICRQKGTHVLLDAVPQLPEGTRVVLAGPIEQFDELDRPDAAAEWRASIDRAGATYLGRVPDDRLPALLNAADVFVMPTVELEMQGMAALEAQASGTPVVATDHGGLPETVPDHCGVRVPPGDTRALAEALGELLLDEDRRTELGRRARQHAVTYDWRRVADRSIALYEEVLR